MAEAEREPGFDTGSSELIERSKPRVRLFEGCVALAHHSEHCYPRSGRDVRDLWNGNSQHLRTNEFRRFGESQREAKEREGTERIVSEELRKDETDSR